MPEESNRPKPNSNESSASFNEFSELINTWKKENEKPNFDPIPTLKRLSELIEEETVEFQKADPDPFDDRHPEAIIPGCGLGNLITLFTKEDDIINKIINSYLKRGFSVQNPSEITVTAARLLLAVVPGVDVNVMNSSDHSVMEQLYEWAEKSSEPLNIYSIGILAKVLEYEDINIKYTKQNLKMIKKILNDLSAMIFPNNEHTNLQSSSKVKSNRKRQSSTPDQLKKKAKMDLVNLHGNNKEENIKAIIKTSGKSQSEYKLATHDLCDNDISNSSWSEQMPFVIGSIYNLTPPLSNSIKQRFYLDFLKSVGEYQDYLPLFIENKVLDIVKYFINSSIPDGLLTFKALHFLGTLLCHNKIATEFINRHQGINQLLSVQRPSLGSTGVSMCLYYLSYKTEAMDNVCQSFKSKMPLVKYAVWLLECSHESGRCHAALFFSLTFAFSMILNLFDQVNGIRCLLNMVSTSDAILSNEDDGESPSSRQTLKVVCPTLRKYFEAHLVKKVQTLQTITKDSRWKAIFGAMGSVQPTEASLEHIQECIEFVRKFDSVQDIRIKTIYADALGSWFAVDGFLKHKGVSLLLQVISIAVDWRVDLTGRLETLKAALGVLAIVTLTKKAQLLLLKKGEVISRREDENSTGLGLLLDLAEGKFSASNQESDLQKLALEILVNCLYMPPIDENLEKVSKTNAIVSSRGDKKFYEDSKDIKHKLWRFVKQNNGIQIFLSLLLNKQSEVTDEISLLACKALYGLAHLQSVQQILTKLPMFNVSQLQVLMQESVTHGKQKEHLMFCKAIENLVQKVTGKPGSFEIEQNTYLKSLIVSKTQIRYDNKELLALIHSHLVWSGLTSTANLLKKEAQLSSTVLAKMLQVCPKTTSQTMQSLHTITPATSITPTCSRISFSRGSHAQRTTPSGSNNQHPSIPQTPTTPSSSSIKKLLKTRLKNHVSSRFKLSQSGKVTIAPLHASGDVKQEKFLPSLNTIVEKYLKHQHVSCRNPVVTVPEFTLSSKHFCPERKLKVKSSLNITMRRFQTQCNPPCGGSNAGRWDRQFVFSRFRPSYTVKVPDERKINYTCSAFSANDEHLLIGDHKGGVTFHSLSTDQDDIIEGVGSGEIGSLQPNKYNDSLIVIYENLWNYHCSLYTTGNQFELKFAFPNTDYAEFSKVRQDKVVGTKNHKAMVFDANNGKLLYSVQKQELACNYSWNRATFSYDDNLLLSDGLLWDVRGSLSEPIHKFDKFSDFGDSLFHPDGTEVIINSQVWDLRNYHLLHSVPSFDQKRLYFNRNGTIIYGVKGNDLDEERTSWSGANVSSFDAHDYTHLTTYEVKHDIISFATDGKDCRLAMIEKSTHEDSRSYDSAISNCRIYDIGINKSEDYDDDDESELEHESDSDESSNDNSELEFTEDEVEDDLGSNDDHDDDSDEDIDIHIMSGSDFDSSNFPSGDSDADF